MSSSWARRGTVLLGLVLASLSIRVDAEDPKVTTSEGFVSIFDGKSLNGWIPEGVASYIEGSERKPIWSAENGNLICRGKGFGFLRFDKKVSDFVLRLEYKMGKGCNSGVGIRGVAYTGGRGTRPSLAAYEIQILDDIGQAPSEKGTGSLYRYVAPKENPALAAPNWNVMEVECKGPHIKVVLNGKVIQDVDQSKIESIAKKPLEGFISVQNHGQYIEFRKIELKTLAPTA